MRLDLALETRGLLPSRARARDAVLRGTVTVNGVQATKPHQLVADTDAVWLDDPAARYVSRSALKLIAGLDAGGIAVPGKTCLDLGASTGGFTQVLVERGAARVFAVDVGHGQLHQRLRDDPRVTSLEGTNARDLDRAIVPNPVDLLVCDVSFVAATKILAAPLDLCVPGAEAVILIKPQFEAGLEHVGRGGIVRDPVAIEAATVAVIDFMSRRGWDLATTTPSPIPGGDGNTETVAVFTRS
jgi:23S rRNA (cytidine1920-2'-O)/16S rRNA (cytidine1409-2'-O)-methyltransferase